MFSSLCSEKGVVTAVVLLEISSHRTVCVFFDSMFIFTKLLSESTNVETSTIAGYETNHKGGATVDEIVLLKDLYCFGESVNV